MNDCLNWANRQLSHTPHLVIKIVKVRAKEKEARIILEVSKDGYRKICGGRKIYVSDLRKKLTNA